MEKIKPSKNYRKVSLTVVQKNKRPVRPCHVYFRYCDSRSVIIPIIVHIYAFMFLLQSAYLFWLCFCLSDDSLTPLGRFMLFLIIFNIDGYFKLYMLTHGCIFFKNS